MFLFISGKAYFSPNIETPGKENYDYLIFIFSFTHSLQKSINEKNIFKKVENISLKRHPKINKFLVFTPNPNKVIRKVARLWS